MIGFNKKYPEIYKEVIQKMSDGMKLKDLWRLCKKEYPEHSIAYTTLRRWAEVEGIDIALDTRGRKKNTPANRAKLKEADELVGKMSYADISRKTGYSDQTIINRAKRDNKHIPGNRLPRLKAMAEEKEAVNLRRQNLTDIEIGKKLGFSSATASRRVDSYYARQAEESKQKSIDELVPREDNRRLAMLIGEARSLIKSIDGSTRESISQKESAKMKEAALNRLAAIISDVEVLDTEGKFDKSKIDKIKQVIEKAHAKREQEGMDR